jgi:hypothetical protein
LPIVVIVGAVRTVVVDGPDGVRWNVRVEWAPRWRALARRFGGWRAKRKSGDDAGDIVGGTLDVASSGGGSGSGGGGGGWSLGDELLAIAVVLIAFVAAAALFWWVLLPLLLVVLDALIVVVLLVLSIVGRVLLRRPWTVRATGAGGATFAAQVVGWRNARRQRDEMADDLRRGLRPVGGSFLQAR